MKRRFLIAPPSIAVIVAVGLLSGSLEVWGSSSTDVFAVGMAGTILHLQY